MRLRRRRPVVSVVVPAYNVERFLGASLDSILSQSYRHLEVIVVDDGSTDGTGDVADQSAAADSRVRVIHQDNAGLGAARNIGVRHATGDYLAFADSDDLVLEHAYATMVGALERSGSDIAIGAVERLQGTRRFMTRLMRENHQERRTAVRVEDAPALLADVFAWNKVFSRSFWDAEGLTFPEGVRYEDQPTLTRALVAARFDVLPEPVYLWQVRADGSSISQQRGEQRDISDRLLTKRWSTETVLGRTPPAVHEVWYRKVLPVDMPEYFLSVPGCSDEFWSTLRAGMEEFWGPHTVPFERTSLLLRQRIMGWLVQQDRRSDLEKFVGYLTANPGPLPEVHPFSGEPGLPPELRSTAGRSGRHVS